MNSTSYKLFRKRLSKNRFLKFGVPFITLIVGGSFALEKFTVLRYETKNGKEVSLEKAEKKYGVDLNRKKTEVTLESVYDELSQKDISTWQNIRGPRPWEDSKQVQDLQRKDSV